MHDSSVLYITSMTFIGAIGILATVVVIVLQLGYYMYYISNVIWMYGCDIQLFVWNCGDFFTVPLHSPNGRHLSTVKAMRGAVNIGSEKRWEFPLVMWVDNAMGL